MSHLLVALLAPLLLVACASTGGPAPGGSMVSHDVYFSLRDRSPEAVARLVEACHERLGALPGIVFFTAGGREAGLERDVNDVEFDVALHVVFGDRASHDAYQEAPEHLRFIEENRENWASVRVFDSRVTGGQR